MHLSLWLLSVDLVCYPTEPIVRRALPAKTISARSIAEPLRCGMAITGQLKTLHVLEGGGRKREDPLEIDGPFWGFWRGHERESLCIIREAIGKARRWGWGEGKRVRKARHTAVDLGSLHRHNQSQKLRAGMSCCFPMTPKPRSSAILSVAVCYSRFVLLWFRPKQFSHTHFCSESNFSSG